MNPIEFLKTIYLGDRYCTKLSFDNVNKQVILYVNIISRIRDKSGLWNCYFKEDILDGGIVIANVKKIILDQSGLLPNDEIYDIYAREVCEDIYEFSIEASHVDEKGITTNLILKIIGEKVYLIDPQYPNNMIRE